MESDPLQHRLWRHDFDVLTFERAQTAFNLLQALLDPFLQTFALLLEVFDTGSLDRGDLREQPKRLVALAAPRCNCRADRLLLARSKRRLRHEAWRWRFGHPFE
jgi:hypothetical protein